MKVLVSGGTGFLGQAIAKALLHEGHTVWILSRNLRKAKNIFAGSPAEIVEGDVTKRESLSRSLEGIETVVQCAQFPGHPVENKKMGWTYWQTDALGTENLAKAAKEAKVQHFIYLSGGGTNGKRAEPWFKAKWHAEQAIHATGIAATVLRPSLVYGPGDKSLNRIAKQIKYFPIVPLIGGGKNRIQPIFIENLAKIVAACVATSGGENRIFDVGGPAEMTFKELLKTVARVLNKKRLLLSIPKWLVKIAALFLQFLPNPPLNPRAVDFITMDVKLDTTPLKRAFPQIVLKPVLEALNGYLHSPKKIEKT